MLKLSFQVAKSVEAGNGAERPGHKYIRREAGANNKWRYFYHDAQGKEYEGNDKGESVLPKEVESDENKSKAKYTDVAIYRGKEMKDWHTDSFPITEEELLRARKRFRQERGKNDSVLSSARQVPQTYARDILREIVPNLSDFDLIVLGYAVVGSKVKLNGRLLGKNE